MAIKNLKSKRDKHDTNFMVGSSKRGSGGSKKSKKDFECWNCHKRGHTRAKSWAPMRAQKGRAEEVKRITKQNCHKDGS